MLISADRLQRFWGIRPRVLLHIGAHEAEELRAYRRLNWGAEHTVWVEALPEKAERVRSLVSDLPQHSVVNAVVWNRSGEKVRFNETNNGESSSALKLGEHARLYPSIYVSRERDFTTSTVADAVDLDSMGDIDLVNIDIQGAELRALEGFGVGLDRVAAIYSEVNTRELYVGAAQFDELDAWLTERGFVLVDWTVLRLVGWGDALWMRRDAVPSRPRLRRAVRKAIDLPSRLRHVVGWAVRKLQR